MATATNTIARAATDPIFDAGGEACLAREFFRGEHFLEAEGTTHSLLIERGSASSWTKRRHKPIRAHEFIARHGRRAKDNAGRG